MLGDGARGTCDASHFRLPVNKRSDELAALLRDWETKNRTSKRKGEALRKLQRIWKCQKGVHTRRPSRGKSSYGCTARCTAQLLAQRGGHRRSRSFCSSSSLIHWVFLNKSMFQDSNFHCRLLKMYISICMFRVRRCILLHYSSTNEKMRFRNLKARPATRRIQSRAATAAPRSSIRLPALTRHTK